MGTVDTTVGQFRKPTTFPPVRGPPRPSLAECGTCEGRNATHMQRRRWTILSTAAKHERRHHGDVRAARRQSGRTTRTDTRTRRRRRTGGGEVGVGGTGRRCDGRTASVYEPTGVETRAALVLVRPRDGGGATCAVGGAKRRRPMAGRRRRPTNEGARGWSHPRVGGWEKGVGAVSPHPSTHRPPPGPVCLSLPAGRSNSNRIRKSGGKHDEPRAIFPSFFIFSFRLERCRAGSTLFRGRRGVAASSLAFLRAPSRRNGPCLGRPRALICIRRFAYEPREMSRVATGADRILPTQLRAN